MKHLHWIAFGLALTSGSVLAATRRARPVTTPATPTTLVLGSGSVIAQGTITRDMSQFTDHRTLVAGTGAYLEIEVRRYDGEDIEAPLIAAARVNLPPGTVRFPLRYELRSAYPLLATESYLIAAEIVSNNTSSRFKLMSEFHNEIRGPRATASFSVGGLERCGTPTSGGFCE